MLTGHVLFSVILPVNFLFYFIDSKKTHGRRPTKDCPVALRSKFPASLSRARGVIACSN
jgi:hypothetical protein